MARNQPNQKRRKPFAPPKNVGKSGGMKQFFDEVYRPLRLRDGSFRTVALYGNLFRRLAEHLGRPPTLDDLNDLAVSGFLAARKDAGRSPYTVARERSQLIALWNVAARRGMVDRWPEVPPPRLPHKSPEAWTVAEMHRLFDAARTARGWVNGVRANVWWPALIAVLWETGERISAILATRKADYRRPHLIVRASSRKGGLDDKIFKLTPGTCHRLELAMAHDQPKIFYWPGCHSGLWGAFKRLVQRAKLDIGRGSGFHKIRRSAASHYAAAGGDATEFLGHRSPELANRWYLDPLVTRAGKPEPCDVLPRID
jgi:integrase